MLQFLKAPRHMKGLILHLGFLKIVFLHKLCVLHSYFVHGFNAVGLYEIISTS